MVHMEKLPWSTAAEEDHSYKTWLDGDHGYHPWPGINSTINDLLRRMLMHDPGRRATIKEILCDKWMHQVI
ncbi:unnamed protein product [Adineta steineri]|uniref:Uncharacterized protein n=1 Tax=Adineta steineri TaxID=433720 RepID=A0A813SRH2_9BILA|nr:unnamed protein product [Adineta steineri]